MRVWTVVWIIILSCSACNLAPIRRDQGSSSPTPLNQPYTATDPTRTRSLPSPSLNAPSETAAKPTIPAITQLPPIGERITFEAEDGTPLFGEYFPANGAPAPAVILMHPLNSNRRIWVRKGVVSWLNNSVRGDILPSTASPAALMWQPLPKDVSFAVFIFDFRGHGESQGGSKQMSDYLMDARAALAVVRGLPGIDPQRIALIGASIGADAAADLCQEECIGTLGLSPGSRLGVPYTGVVTQLSLAAKPVWCLAGSGDTRSAQACITASGETFRSLVYSGTAAHGVDLLVPGFDPEITQVFREFLSQAFNF